MLTTSLRRRAAELGFTLMGLIPAAPSPFLAAYLRWIEAGYHGEMGYMARPDRVSRRQDLNVILPGVRSLVVVGLEYADVGLSAAALRDPLRGRFSNYAWGLDYHDLMTPRLEALAAWLAERAPDAPAQRVYVDTGAILERGHAQAAGLGFIGKNTLLIHPRRGSYLFLGEILTTLEFDDYDEPAPPTMCGGCTRCLAACPTDAFPAPYVLDARRCISYLTIEYKGHIVPELAACMGNWVYGCDVCQEVCPYVRRFTQPGREGDLRAASLDRAAPPLRDLLALDAAGFRAWYAGSAVARVGLDRLLRNAAIAAGNSGAAELRPALAALAAREDVPLAAEQARRCLDGWR